MIKFNANAEVLTKLRNLKFHFKPWFTDKANLGNFICYAYAEVLF